MEKEQITLSEINSFDQASFVEKLGSLFEGPPWIVKLTWDYRPFYDCEDLYQKLCSIMFDASHAQKVALLQAHPDLVGKMALSGSLTPESAREQAAAGLNLLTAGEIEEFGRYNRAYRTRFGFPFVICARQNKKESILSGFAARISNSPNIEVDLALKEVAKICRLRLMDLVRC